MTIIVLYSPQRYLLLYCWHQQRVDCPGQQVHCHYVSDVECHWMTWGGSLALTVHQHDCPVTGWDMTLSDASVFVWHGNGLGFPTLSSPKNVVITTLINGISGTQLAPNIAGTKHSWYQTQLAPNTAGNKHS